MSCGGGPAGSGSHPQPGAPASAVEAAPAHAAGGGSAAAAVLPAAAGSAAARRHIQRILGIDPGSRITGYGLLESDGSRSRWLASGCIRPRGESLAQILAGLQRELGRLLQTWAPDVVAVEAVFYQRNARSALVLGQARGALLASCGLAGVDTAEYAPAQVKLAVTGSGAAAKDQVERMVRAILGRRDAMVADEADALAVALCHAQQQRLAAAIARSERAGASAGGAGGPAPRGPRPPVGAPRGAEGAP